MAARLTALAFAALVAARSAVAAPGELEHAAARAARGGDWPAVLSALETLKRESPERYADGRFDYLAARALAATGRPGEALSRFER